MELYHTVKALEAGNIEYQFEHTVVEKKKWYEYFYKEGNYIGKNIYGNDVHNILVYGTAPDVVGFSKFKSIRTLFRGSWVMGLKALPTLDETRKVHGLLPKAIELSKYSVDELKIFLKELKINVVTRGKLNGKLGTDYNHSFRVAQEHELIRKIEKILENLHL